MAITKFPPRTIHLGGPYTEVGDVKAGAAFLPGHLIERYNASGVALWRKHSVAGGPGSTFALNQSMLNLGTEDAYAAGDLVQAVVAETSTTIWGRLKVGVGQTVVNGTKLESAGDGTLIIQDEGIAIAQALESKDATLAEQMLRIEVL